MLVAGKAAGRLHELQTTLTTASFWLCRCGLGIESPEMAEVFVHEHY